MPNLAPFELLIAFIILVVIPAVVGYGLYRLIRRAVADGHRDSQDKAAT